MVTNQRAIAEIAARAEPRDFLCIIGGTCQEAIGAAFPDMITVEFGVGYSGVFAKHRVFESYAWMHAVHGAHTTLPGIMSDRGRFFDAVIPNYFEVDDFPFSAEKDDYYLFIGRLIESKGYQIAVDTCRTLERRLVIAGAGTPPDFGEYAGIVDVQRRGELMSRARAVFVPSLYLEPFGGVHVEAMLCGTPVITTDWGAFSETVQNGVHGFRCRTLRQFCDAADAVDKLDYAAIRESARRALLHGRDRPAVRGVLPAPGNPVGGRLLRAVVNSTESCCAAPEPAWRARWPVSSRPSCAWPPRRTGRRAGSPSRGSW